jgi:hypothetical protein
MGKNPEGFVAILYAENKSNLGKHCRTTTLYGTDLVNLILASQTGLSPFRHKIHFREFIPDDIQLRDSDLKMMAKAKVGPIDNATAKAFGRVDQIFRHRRLLTGHIFFLCDFTKWTLFYFDQRDTSQRGNHWKHGSHLHVLTHLWPRWTAKSIWKEFVSGNPEISGALHVRFELRDYTHPEVWASPDKDAI